MYKLVACIVIYNTKFEEIKDLIVEFYKKNLEQHLVVVDNSNTGYLKNELLQLNDSIDYIINKNTGYASGNNIAIKKYKNKAKYFLILNPDIFFSIENLEKLIDYAESKQNFGVIMPKILSKNGEIQNLCKLLPTPLNLFSRRFLVRINYFRKTNFDYELQFMDYNKEVTVPVLSGCFMFCHYDTLVRENGFDERFFMYLEDVDLCRRMYKYGNFYLPSCNITHIHKKESYKNFKMTAIHIHSSIKYFNKWGWFFDRERKTINREIMEKYKKGNF